jgi:hypothetical protein
MVMLVLSQNAPAGELRDGPGNGELTVGRYRLKPDGKGGYVGETEKFVARIAPDGAVTFRDRFRLPGPAVWPVLLAAQALQNATVPREKGVPADPTGKKLSYHPKQPLLTFGDDDLYDDSFHAQKMSFLEATASLRKRLQSLKQESALRSWRKQIDSLAADRRRTPAERRRLLFEQWADCEDPPAGAAARALVEAAAREHFPPGSPDAYRPDELATFNRGRPPGQRFDPYAAR